MHVELNLTVLHFRGIQLIERNEEVCVFYEKVNIQGTLFGQVCMQHNNQSNLNVSCLPESMIRNGDVELNAREEEIRFLKLEVCQYHLILHCMLTLIVQLPQTTKSYGATSP